jgi:hypothetical protein
MSDQSIAAIARSLAAALLAPEDQPELMAEIEALKKRAEEKRIAALQKELCAEYHNEIRVTLKD